MALTDHITDGRTPARKIADLVRRSIPSQADSIERSYRLNYDRIWNTPGVDPQDVLDELGTDAGPIFVLTNQIMGLARPASLKSIPDQYTYVINEDSTITLTPVDRSSSSSETSLSDSSVSDSSVSIASSTSSESVVL